LEFIMASYGVALWFAILSLSPAICHEHADGDADHSHGYGLFSLSPLLAPTCSPESELAPHSRHYHLVLFGIEITILPGCAALETGILHGQNNSTMSWSGDLGQGHVAERPASQPIALPGLTNDSLPVSLDISAESCPLADPPGAPCALARPPRSGIQLI
jgi:hypothetical protein